MYNFNHNIICCTMLVVAVVSLSSSYILTTIFESKFFILFTKPNISNEKIRF